MFFGKNEGQPVTVVCVEHTFVEGKLLEQSTVVKDMPHELALELASSGKVRVAKDVDIEAFKASARKANKTPAEA
jgi:hypothetical protein